MTWMTWPLAATCSGSTGVAAITKYTAVRVIFTLSIGLSLASAALLSAGAVCSASSCTLVPYDTPAVTARASLDVDSAITQGWGHLVVEAAPGDEPLAAAFAAGFLEGALTANRSKMMLQHYRANLAPWLLLPPAKLSLLLQFVTEGTAWMRAQAAANPQDVYWQQVILVLQQFEGMVGGVTSMDPDFSRADLVLMNLVSEMSDILQALNVSARPNYGKMTPEELRAYVDLHSHCSAIFKVTDNLSEVYSAHATWSLYFTMLRVYKSYDLPFAPVASGVRFSGYPGTIAGVDDFYVTSQKLAVIETTNSVFNTSLYDAITPKSVPYWVRVTVANRMASTAAEWHNVFYRHNSGTYNNQWMTFDYKAFTPLPGYYHAEDQTQRLQFGYWPSYNVPFYEDIYNLSGYPAIVQKMGLDNSYQLAPRAKIFRRDAGALETLENVQDFMRINNFRHNDPLAPTATSAIAARGDFLRPALPFGAIDAKVTSAELINKLQASVIAGPTTRLQPPFTWNGVFANISHQGMPTVFNFSYVIL